MKMTAIKVWIILLFNALALGSVLAQQDGILSQDEIERRRNSWPDTTGTGIFPAIKRTDDNLPGFTIYHPQDLDALENTKLGIYAFGNGSCTDDGAYTRLHNLEIASHGYLVIVPGSIYTGPDAIQRPATADEPPTRPEQLEEAINWALKENTRPDSPFYGLIDPDAVAMSGWSCGGVQALVNAGDERIKTVVIMYSGLFVEGITRMAGMEVGKDILNDLHTPTLYILGGPTDIAYENGMDDISRIHHIPIAVANIQKGHQGTFWEPNGGAAAQVVVKWLNWQLRGDNSAAEMFTGEHCGLCTDAEWSFERNGF